jgi:hypothetical protein
MQVPVTPSHLGKKPDERRIAPRFQPAYGTVFRMDALAKAGGDTIGLVWNISQTGVSMLVGSPPKAGAKVLGELTPEAGGHGLAVVLCVVHVRPIQTGDFFVGAQFERPLEPQQVQLFLVPQAKAGKSAAATPDKTDGVV